MLIESLYKKLYKMEVIKLRHKMVKNTLNYENINDFLKTAISDLTGNLNLLDTKVSIIMATVGVVLGLVVACKSNILKAYYFYVNNFCYKTIFLLFAVIYVVSIIITFVFGISCIMIRFGKSKQSSLWFFKTEDFGGLSECQYLHKIKNMTDEAIMKNLAVEVYKLNIINNRKMRAGKMTMVLFSISCAAIAMLMIMVGITYLVV